MGGKATMKAGSAFGRRCSGSCPHVQWADEADEVIADRLPTVEGLLYSVFDPEELAIGGDFGSVDQTVDEI